MWHDSSYATGPIWTCAFMSRVSAPRSIRMRCVRCDRVASYPSLMHHSFKTFISQIYSQQAHHIWIRTSHMNENIMYERVTSRVNESRDVRMSHVTFGGGMSRMSESSPMTCEWVMSCKSRDVLMSHVIRSESSHMTYEWVMSCIMWTYAFISHANESCHMHVNESCQIWKSHVTCEWVMSHVNVSCHIWMSHVTFEWAMSCIMRTCAFMSHVDGHVTCEWVTSPVNESCHMWMSHVTFEWVMSHYYTCMHPWW